MNFNELITGVIVAAVSGSAASLITMAINDKHSKNELYAKTISSCRMEWINKMRKYLVDLIVLCKKINRDDKDKNKFEHCRASILLRLNHTSNKEKYNNKLKDLLNNMTFDQICEPKNNIAEKIEHIGPRLLKDEWERVKNEAGETIKKYEEIDLRMEEIKQYKESLHPTDEKDSTIKS